MMVKRIGKHAAVALSLLWCCASYAEPRVDLFITDMNGNRLTSVTAGVPFQAHVAVIDVDEHFSAPVLHGVQNFVRGSMSSSSQYTVINGARSSKRTFSYVLRADRPGSVTLGPARIHHNSAVLESPALKLEIRTSQEKKDADTTDEPASLRVTVDKKNVVVGESIHVTVTVLHDVEARLRSPLLVDVESAGFETGVQQQPTTQQVEINGKPYLQIEQKLELFAREPGAHTIPAVSAQCQVPVRRNASHPRFDFDDFFGRRAEVYQIYSSPVPIEVQKLPPTDKDVFMVGEVKRIALSTEQRSAQVGEGVVVRLEIEGVGNEKKIAFPSLALPQELTYYDSKTDVEHRDNSWTKTFEYIVQGTAPGTYEIPSQRFAYFDSASKSYKTKKTTPLQLKIKPGAYTATNNPVHEEEHVQESGAEEASAILSLPQERYSWFDRIPSLPMTHFAYLRFALILLILGFPRLIGWYRGSPRKRACRKARRLLNYYKKKQDATQLYQLMMDLFAKYMEDYTVISEQGTLSYLEAQGFDQDMIDAWSKDVQRFAEASFFSRTDENKHELFERAAYWIITLEKLS